MDYIREKIKKLLALGESPNENEARAALLKARSLMAEHKLKAEDLSEDAQVIRKTVGITCTKWTDSWAIELGVVVAEHYCCAAYRRRSGDRYELGLIGMDEDFELCKRILLYAYESVKSGCDAITFENRKRGMTEEYIRRARNSYGVGFCAGLDAAYAAQDEAHQDWALVLSKPKKVADKIAGMEKAEKPFMQQRFTPNDGLYLGNGYLDGLRFDPGKRLSAQSATDTAPRLDGA